MLAYTYPLLSLFWTMLLIFGFVVWIWLLIVVFGDIFRSHDMGGFAKALWVLLVIFLPLVGVLIYLIARGGQMQQRATQDARQQRQEFDTYVQDVAASGAKPADQLAKLAQLRDEGVITEQEFRDQKAKVMA
ncbi:MAG: SHOCT domain-containing protein [Acidimicrobiales bacterium]